MECAVNKRYQSQSTSAGNPVMLKSVSLKIVVCKCGTFYNIKSITISFTKYLKESCWKFPHYAFV